MEDEAQIDATWRIAETALALNPQRPFDIEVAEDLRQPLIEAFEAMGCLVNTSPLHPWFTVSGP